MSSDIIEVKLERTNVLTRWPCGVCGGTTEKVPILAESAVVRVCERCLKDGDIDAKLSAYANELEADQLVSAAQRTRGMIGRLKVPTYAEWLAEMRREEEEEKRGLQSGFEPEFEAAEFSERHASLDSLFD